MKSNTLFKKRLCDKNYELFLGQPKGVILSHHMILNNAYQVTYAQEYHKDRTIICLQVPLYHCFGMVLASLTSICHGVTNVLPSYTFDPEESLQAIEKEK